MATTLFQAVSSFPGKVYAAFGQVVETVSGRRAERDRSEFVDFLQEKLVSAFRAGRIRLLPYYDNLTAETAEHRLAYRWLLKEPAIKSAFMSKLLSVMSLDLQVDPANEEPRNKEISTFVEDALRRCHGGPAEIVWAILFGALLEGNGLAEKVFGVVHRGKYRGRPTITTVKSKDSHDYQIEIDEFNNPTKVISRRTADEFPMSDFTFWSHMPGFSNPAGMSDLRAVYRAGWMLDTVWKLRAIGLERFTLPIFMSKYPAGRLDIRDSINEAVKKAKSLGYLSVPQEAAVEAIEMASKSGSDFDSAIKALQEECFIGIQGATLQAMAGNVPDGAGKSSVHKSTTELFVWYLSVAAATVINDQIIPDLVDLNYADADYPTCWLGGINDGDLKAALDIDLGLLQLGLVQDPQDLARRYRRQMAKNPQQALETLKLIKTMGMQQPPPGMGGGGMPDMGGGPPGLPGGDGGAPVDPMQQVMDHMQDGGGNGGAIPFDESFGEDFADGDNYYHGDNPPEGWKQVGTGPRGGKIWASPGGGKVSGNGIMRQGYDEAKSLSRDVAVSAFRNEFTKGTMDVVAHGYLGMLERLADSAGVSVSPVDKITIKVDTPKPTYADKVGQIEAMKAFNENVKGHIRDFVSDLKISKQQGEPIDLSNYAGALASAAAVAASKGGWDVRGSYDLKPTAKPEKMAEEDWQGPNKGKRGGTYWVNKKTGEKAYQQDNPGGSGGDKARQERLSVVDEVNRRAAALDSKQAGGASVDEKKIIDEYQKFERGPGSEVHDLEDARQFLDGPMAGMAAITSFASGGFVDINSNPNDPVSKAASEYVSKLPDAKVSKMHRVIAFDSDEARDQFLSKLGKPGGTATQERTFSSWTKMDPNAPGQTPMNNIGLDLASQFGDKNVFLSIDQPKGAKEVSFLYGGGNGDGTEYLLQRGAQYQIKSVTKDAKGNVVVSMGMKVASTAPPPPPEAPKADVPPPSKLQTSLAKEKAKADQAKADEAGKQAALEARPDLAKGKSADRIKTKPEGWGAAAIIPGNTHRGVWNVATSTGYARAKPLIDEAARIYANPGKATKEEVRALAHMIANTTGQDALYTLAQAAGVSGGGGAKAVAQRVVAPLGHDVGELPDNDMTKEAALQKKAKAEGATPTEAKQMTTYARQLRDEGNKQVDLRNTAVKDAYARLSKATGKPFTQNHPAFNGGDHTSVKGFDTVASELAGAYPGLFSADASYDGGGSTDNKATGDHVEKLWAMLGEGLKPRLTINDTFQQVMDETEELKKYKKPDEVVPFHEEFASKPVTWQGPNTGPHGGTYWVNSRTGRHLYQKEKPGTGDDDAGDDPLWAKDPNEPKEVTPPPTPPAVAPPPAAVPPADGKRSLLKPKPAGWGDQSPVPGRTHRGVWNIATSTGYGRAKPVLDEISRLFKDPGSITEADIEKVKGMIAAQKGQDAVYTIAVALGIPGGKAGKVADTAAKAIADAKPKQAVPPPAVVPPPAPPATVTPPPSPVISKPKPAVVAPPKAKAGPGMTAAGVKKPTAYESVRKYVSAEPKLDAFIDVLSKKEESKRSQRQAHFNVMHKHEAKYAALRKQRDALPAPNPKGGGISPEYADLSKQMANTWRDRNKEMSLADKQRGVSREEFVDAFHSHFGKPKAPILKGKTAIKSAIGKNAPGEKNSKRRDEAAEFYNGFMHAVVSSGCLHKEEEERAHYSLFREDDYRNFYRTRANEDVGTHVHEMGHHIEYHSPGVRRAAQRFLEERKMGEKPIHMGAGYKPDEKGIEDDFGKAFGESGRYVGKIYDHGGTEIVSMGFEKLHNDAYTLMTKDPEYFKFLMAVATGAFA